MNFNEQKTERQKPVVVETEVKTSCDYCGQEFDSKEGGCRYCASERMKLQRKKESEKRTHH